MCKIHLRGAFQHPVISERDVVVFSVTLCDKTGPIRGYCLSAVMASLAKTVLIFLGFCSLYPVLAIT